MTEYLNKVDVSRLLKGISLADNQLGNVIETEYKASTDFSEYDIALVGVALNKDNEAFLNVIRTELYQLFDGFEGHKIIDLGNINPGKTTRDTEAALSMVIEDLDTYEVVSLVICDNPALVHGQFKGFRLKESMVNLSVIDEKIAFNPTEEDLSVFYLNKIMEEEQQILFNLSHLGHQVYLTDTKAVEVMNKMNFDVVRLGQVKNQMDDSEIFLRDANIVMMHMDALSASDYSSTDNASPNGFSAEQCCRLTRYAGLSPNVRSFGFYGLVPDKHSSERDAKLIAQSIWYFADGYCGRLEDDLPGDEQADNFLKYFVDLKDQEYQLSFWKSKMSNRWWMAFIDDNGDKPTQFVSCSYKDYQAACQNELPDRWMKNYLKIY